MCHSKILKISVLTFGLIASLMVTANETVNKEAKVTIEIPELVGFKTSHKGKFNGVKVNYDVVAAETALANDKGEVVGHLFATSYFRTNDKSENRPVAFVFNGGPGSASTWLHMGLLGPKKVDLVSDASADDGAAPFSLSNNDLTILDKADLVFIDPIGTGYSRLVGEGKPEDFWSLKADTDSIAEFIRIWVTQNKRWNSAKYLIGESYGSPRAVGVAKALRSNGLDIALNGIVMISQAMDYTGSTPVDDNLVAFVTYFPTLTAVAHFHKKAGVGESLESFLDKSRAFAVDEYLPALFKGNLLSDIEKKTIAAKMSTFIGLDQSYILQSDLRVLSARFTKELLRDQGKTVGILDGRYTSEEVDLVAGRPSSDAASESIGSAYAVAINHYMQEVLNINVETPYYLSSSKVGKNWDWAAIEPNAYDEPEYVKVARILSKEMRKNKDLKLLVASGYYDLVTPFFDAEYTVARHGFKRENITMTYYPAGHMMYVNKPSLNRLLKDIHDFID
ncbi:S10 family peptidase [Paraglaciecola marina]|uniref:S10 family peptidase n=1 Tax=Paraglaciecola marina TaxID=2500157 RepID=UPI00105E8130|nr:peptidase S10 [Paraglaciecola marina]